MVLRESDSDEDNTRKKDRFDDGITLLKRTGGRNSALHLNSYGPKNSAMLTWGSAQANEVVNELTYLHGKPHNQALDRDDKDGHYLHGGKIRCIISIAWKPKRKIKSMTDLLESVEELNPANKQPNKRYRFPFSTVLVEIVSLGRIWIDRTGYKTLTTTTNKEKGHTGKKEKGRSAKKEHERTDRKFYEIALHQVKRYQEYIGETRTGEKRTPTP